MDQPTITAVRRLLESAAPVSRNRCLERFSGEKGMRVWRLYKVYRSLMAELELALAEPEATVRIRPEGQALRVRIDMQSMAYCRENLVPPDLAEVFIGRFGAEIH